jgi:hypothetical protein
VPADREKLMDTVKATFDGKLDILVMSTASLSCQVAHICI